MADKWHNNGTQFSINVPISSLSWLSEIQGHYSACQAFYLPKVELQSIYYQTPKINTKVFQDANLYGQLSWVLQSTENSAALLFTSVLNQV